MSDRPVARSDACLRERKTRDGKPNSSGEAEPPVQIGKGEGG